MAPVSWALDKYYYVGASPGWTHFPHRDNLFFVVNEGDSGKAELKVVYGFDTKVSIDITGASVRRPGVDNSTASSQLLVVARSPVLAVRFLQNNQETNRFQIRFKLVEDFEAVVFWLESHGYPVKRSTDSSKGRKVQPNDVIPRANTSYQMGYGPNSSQMLSQMQPPAYLGPGPSSLSEGQQMRAKEHNGSYAGRSITTSYDNSIPQERQIFESHARPWSSQGSFMGQPGLSEPHNTMAFNESSRPMPPRQQYSQAAHFHNGYYPNPPRSSGMDIQHPVSIPTPPTSQYQRLIHTSDSNSSGAMSSSYTNTISEPEIIMDDDDLPPPRPPAGFNKQPSRATKMPIDSPVETLATATKKRKPHLDELPPLKVPTPVLKSTQTTKNTKSLTGTANKKGPSNKSIKISNNTSKSSPGNSSTLPSTQSSLPESSDITDLDISRSPKRTKLDAGDESDQNENETEEARHERESNELEQRVIETLQDDDFIKLCENLSRVWHRMGFANAGKDIFGRNKNNAGRTV
ncbi:hypothetical protein EDC01DRAFT_731783 [Geopyxis carbonaria]|nr:hypothetical protein EDC01DRAFT_731783 [Geopyxis carbonaria]